MRHIRWIALALIAGVLCSQPSGSDRVGLQADGSFLLPTGWRLKPAGTQIPLDTLPISSALSPDGKYLLVLNAGYKAPTIAVFPTDTMKESARVPVADAWLGLTFSPDGSKVYVGGASKFAVYEFNFANGTLTPGRTFEVNRGAMPGNDDFIGDVATSPDGRLLYAADMYHDAVDVLNAQTGLLVERHKTGRRPYRILFHPDGKSFFVSSWADATVYQHDATTLNEMNRIRTGAHSTDMVIVERRPGDSEETEDKTTRYRLFVAAANADTVYSVGIDNLKNLRLLEAINVAMTPNQPIGMTPSGLSISPDRKTLYVACSDGNAVAVSDISEDRAHVLGFVPAGWYPTAVRALRDGRLLVLNGRGKGSGPTTLPGPAMPRSATKQEKDAAKEQYVAQKQIGSMSVLAPFDENALDAYTKTVLDLTAYRDSKLDTTALGSSPVISRPGRPSPIEHVIYIIKENRTYDQVFGKIGKGNGDPSLTLFDEKVAPNHYKIARDFVLFDNFYTNADISAEGHNWSTAGIAPDYTQKLWPHNYANRTKRYDFEGGEPANTPPAGYIWTNAIAAGKSVRNYGEFLELDKTKPIKEADSSLAGITNLKFKGFDGDYPDVERAKVFLDDLKQFEAQNSMPNLMIVRIGNDHTDGTTPGKLTPFSMFADNDLALGMIVEAVSKSKFWSKTAIFSLEDDAQNGPDHVDSHRSVLMVASPYTKRGVIDSTMYNTSSVLRTMELILGMRPMTAYDAGARVMNAAFTDKPDARPYTSEAARVSLTERNPQDSPTASRSKQLDFQEADLADDDELNAILYLAIKGTPPPAPVRSFFGR